MTATELIERIRKEHQTIYPDGCHDMRNCSDCQARQADKVVRKAICPNCGGWKTSGQSCVCFDNGAQ